MSETTLTIKGQVAIPAGLRHRLGLKPKDRVTFELDGDAIKIRRANSKIMAGFGAVSPQGGSATRVEFEIEVAKEASAEG